MAVGVGSQEGGAVAEIALAAVADDEGAAVEVEDYCFAVCVGGVVDGGVPGSAHLDGLDLGILQQYTAVDVFLLGRGDALVAVFFGAGEEGPMGMLADEGGVVGGDGEEFHHEGLTEGP